MNRLLYCYDLSPDWPENIGKMKHKKNNPNPNCKDDVCILQPCGDMSWDNDKCLVKHISRNNACSHVTITRGLQPLATQS